MNYKQNCLLLSFLLTTLFVNAQVTFHAVSTTVAPGESVCVDILVEDFAEITNMQFSMAWNRNIIRLDSITNVNIPNPETFEANLTLAPTGRLPIIWYDPVGAGATVADSSTLFSVCFTALGNAGLCSPVQFTNTPLSMDIANVASNGANIGLVPRLGIVCIANPLVVTSSQVTPANCYDADGSSIELTLDGGLAPYSYNWTGPNGFTSNMANISSLEEGLYILTITDAGTPAQTLVDSFTLVNDFAEPTVNAGENQYITCDNKMVRLNGQASSMGSQFTYMWTTINGNIVSDEQTLMPLVDDGGRYTLRVTNTDNGCFAQATVFALVDSLPPTVQATASGIINCDMQTVLLSSSGSSSGTDISYMWTTTGGNILSGADMATAEVDAAGIYLLTVNNSFSGCSASEEVIVEADNLSPLAEAGAAEVDCENQTVMVAAAGALSDDFEYSWSTSDGALLGDVNSEQVQIGQGGTYSLLITNTANGCTSSSEISVLESLFPMPAQVGEGQMSCASIGSLEAVLPDNAMGEWIADSNAVILDPLMDTTEVSNLHAGWNTFTWTLSTDECPDYDSDTLQIFVESAPGAMDDDLEVPYGQSSANLNLVDNDSLDLVDQWLLSLTSTPLQGSLSDNGDGSVNFSYPLGAVGTADFTYELCNTACIDYCDTATVQIRFAANPNIDTTVHIASGISPNDDGINDGLIIPELIENADQFPDNELIIFNRWGDVVYRAQPYHNDWKGHDNSGRALPHATYYYIMKLDVAEKLIYQGDVTILK